VYFIINTICLFFVDIYTIEQEKRVGNLLMSFSFVSKFKYVSNKSMFGLMQSFMTCSQAAHERLAYSMHQNTCTIPERVMSDFEFQHSYLLG